MAQFRGTIKGNRGEASRLGTKKSGLRVSINGWNVGAYIFIEHVDGKDQIFIYKNGGSNGHDPDKLIARIVEGEK